MVLGIDVDGVLADFASAYAKRIVKVTGENFFPKPMVIPCWDWDVYYGYSKDQIAATWESISKDGLFWQKLKPVAEPEVFTRLNVLSKDHPVYFITNRMGLNCKQQTEKFLYDQGINYPTVIVATNKLPILQAIKADFFVDDRLETMNELVVAQHDPKGKWRPSNLYLIESSYNQTGRDPRLEAATDIKDALQKAGLW